MKVSEEERGLRMIIHKSAKPSRQCAEASNSTHWSPKVRLSPIQTVLQSPPSSFSHVFPRFSHISLYYDNNFIGFPSPPALNSKFFSSFLSLSKVLLLNTFAITSDPCSCFLSLRSSQRHDSSMHLVRTTMAHTR